ncbi:hypothetical protein [Halorientalis pallida]|uniref:Lipoprotein n=1 Tax=Halorientalis pallida TaxID=2479928 RepID=A0A498KVM7_9EURY|nr:hypothetical protein [Halorientalis pallida]RXK48568.1 hypothetical protein EAF64_12895 [Halorientalis pallida]
MQATRPALALLLAFALVTAGCSAFQPSDSRTATFENRDSTAYNLSAYVVPNVDDRSDVLFRATTDNRSDGLFAYAEVQWAHGYRNVTVDDGVRSERVTLSPNETIPVTIENVTADAAVVYVVERSNWSLVHVGFPFCDGANSVEDYHLTLSGGTGTSWSHGCR